MRPVRRVSDTGSLYRSVSTAAGRGVGTKTGSISACRTRTKVSCNKCNVGYVKKSYVGWSTVKNINKITTNKLQYFANMKAMFDNLSHKFSVKRKHKWNWNIYIKLINQPIRDTGNMRAATDKTILSIIADQTTFLTIWF